MLARWALVLDEPASSSRWSTGHAGLLAFAAYDDDHLRHLAVHPDAGGAGRVGSAAVARAVDRIRAGGVEPRLWVLVANDRARGALPSGSAGAPTGAERECPWVPHPTELEMRAARIDRE